MSVSRTSPIATALFALLFAILAVCAPPVAAQGGMADCTAQVDVLHAGHAGPLPLTAGKYRVTLLDSARMTCAEATEQFRRFRAAGDKPLPDPWQVKVSSQTFSDGPGGPAFRVVHVPARGGGGLSWDSIETNLQLWLPI
ncbi:MAG TPA: hypothetical protein VI111_07860, partial [Thermoleophilaceae bacterium]